MNLEKRFYYAEEKLASAIYELSTGKGDVRSRLWNAFLSFHTLTEKDFPNELQNEWKWVWKSLNKKEPIYNHKGEVIFGTVQNTLRHIRNSTGSQIAKRIVDLYFKIENFNSLST